MKITVCLFSKRKGFSHHMAEIITDMGHTCTIITTFGQLMRYIKKTPDLKLLLIDTATFGHPAYDVQEHVLKHNRRFAVHFIDELMATNMTLDKLEYNAYYEILYELRSMLRRNKDYYQIVRFKGPTFSASEKEILHRYNLRPSHVIILKYLESHSGKVFKIDSMSRYLWPQAKKERIQTLYAYIHQIREILPDLYPEMTIERLSTGTYCYHDKLEPAGKIIEMYLFD